MHTLGRRAMRKKGQPLPPFDWRTPSTSCAEVAAQPTSELARIGSPPMSFGPGGGAGGGPGDGPGGGGPLPNGRWSYADGRIVERGTTE